MRVSLLCFLLLSTLLVASADAASIKKSEPKHNSQIAEVLPEISPRNIKGLIRKLVSFGTRHTLSETENEPRGIGAALDSLRHQSGAQKRGRTASARRLHAAVHPDV